VTPTSRRPDVIRAAGGVVWRQRPPAGDGSTEGVGSRGSEVVEVVVVRRDRYDDWSLPKGKLHAGEPHKAAALREVREETGLGCELGPKLATIRYDTLLGPKRVKWWAMTPHDEGAETLLGPEDPGEVAEVVWLPFDEAWRRVTYGTDREVLRRFADVVLAS
jgi:8-oxo-dGTP diphosphatase